MIWNISLCHHFSFPSQTKIPPNPHVNFSSASNLTGVRNARPEQPSCRLSASYITHRAKVKRTSSVPQIFFNRRWGGKKTQGNGLRQQREWECSDLNAESKSEIAKDFPHRLWNTLEVKVSSNFMKPRGSAATPPGRHFTAVRWEPHISGTLFKLEASAFSM